MEGDAVGVEAELAGLHHQRLRHLDVAAELAVQRPFGAVVADEDAAIDPGAGRAARQLLQLGLTVEGEHGDTGFEGGADRALLLDGVAIGDRLRHRTGREAGLHFLEARRIEAGAEADQALEDRGGGIRLDRVVDARQRHRAHQAAIVFLHPVHVEDEARGGRRVFA
jgi:hypothetical protein